MSPRHFLPAILCLVLLITACGGGGGGSDAGSPTATTASISGSITVGTNTDGLSVELRREGTVIKRAAADSAGRFSFAGVAAGSYEVSPSYSDWRFSPASRAVEIAGSDVALAPFAVEAESAGNTPEELAAQDASLAAEPFPGWGAIGLSADRKFALAEPSPGQDRRQWIISTMITRAKSFYGCGHDSPPCTEWDKPAGSNPTLQPKQSLLAYLWGGTRLLEACGAGGR